MADEDEDEAADTAAEASKSWFAFLASDEDGVEDDIPVNFQWPNRIQIQLRASRKVRITSLKYRPTLLYLIASIQFNSIKFNGW